MSPTQSQPAQPTPPPSKGGPGNFHQLIERTKLAVVSATDPQFNPQKNAIDKAAKGPYVIPVGNFQRHQLLRPLHTPHVATLAELIPYQDFRRFDKLYCIVPDDIYHQAPEPDQGSSNRTVDLESLKLPPHVRPILLTHGHRIYALAHYPLSSTLQKAVHSLYGAEVSWPARILPSCKPTHICSCLFPSFINTFIPALFDSIGVKNTLAYIHSHNRTSSTALPLDDKQNRLGFMCILKKDYDISLHQRKNLQLLEGEYIPTLYSRFVST